MDDSFWKAEPGVGLGPLELGLSREATLARLAAAQIEFDPDGDSSGSYIYLPEQDTELIFSDGPAARLIEIEVADESVRFGSAPVIGRPIHEIISLLQIPPEETLWELQDLLLEEEDGVDDEESDEVLLRYGTLWITTLGLGLPLMRGQIDAVKLRLPDAAPEVGHGHYTEAQAELSRSGALDRSSSSIHLSPRASWYHSGSLLLLLAVLGVIVWQAVQYQQRWNASPIVEGEIIATEPPAPHPFPEEFTVVYHDTTGARHEVLFDFENVNTGRRIGDKIEVRYLPEQPDQAMGRVAAHDAALVKFLPWGIGAIVVYLALQAAPLLLSLARPASAA